MATIGNYKEEYLKYDSSSESQPEVMPVTEAGIPNGMFLFDLATGNIYYRFDGDWRDFTV